MKRLGGIGAKSAGLSAGNIKRLTGISAKKRPPLAVPDIPDPMEGLEVDPDKPGNKAEVAMSAALKSLQKKREDEAKSMELTTDGAFYFVAVFDSRDQKMAYLRAKGMAQDGDIYVDGRKLADVDGIEIPAIEVKMPKLFRIDKKYGAMAMKKGEK